RLGHVERGQLVHRSLRAVVIDRDLAEHARMRATGADDAELFLGDRDRLVHLLLGFEEGVIDHCSAPLCSPCLSELSCPPALIRMILAVFALAVLVLAVLALLALLALLAADQRADLLAADGP